MLQDRDVAINARVSAQAALRLKQLANRLNQSYGEILTDLLLAVPVESADWEAPMAAMQERLEQLAAAVESLRAEWAGTAQNRAQGDAAGQGIPKAHLDEKAAEIAVGNELAASGDNRDADGMGEKIEANADTSLHPVRQSPAPAKLTVKEFIAKQIESGERSPTRIAKALNEAGHRTKNGTRYERSAPMIAKALKAVGG